MLDTGTVLTEQCDELCRDQLGGVYYVEQVTGCELVEAGSATLDPVLSCAFKGYEYCI